jgi:hypothetical protein
VLAHKATFEQEMEKTWLAQSYPIFVQSALPNDNEIVRDCQLTGRGGTGKLALMFIHLSGTTTMMMTATPKRVAVASS